jgi:hypothetical protein
MTYLWIYDDNAKKPTATKIAEALGLYRSRFGAPATVILLNPSDVPAGPLLGARVEPAANVQRNNFWVGRE